jgi:hypothetical protein
MSDTGAPIDARIWGGLHYRQSGIHGVNIGTKVARWTLSRYFRTDVAAGAT